MHVTDPCNPLADHYKAKITALKSKKPTENALFCTIFQLILSNTQCLTPFKLKTNCLRT